MTCREARKQKRIEILDKIEKLNLQRCDQCTRHADSNGNNSMCSCPAAVEVRKLGKELMQTTPRRVVVEIMAIKDATLTVDSYKRLKQAGITDQRIAKHFDMGKSTLGRWKKDNDLLSFRTRHRNQEELMA